MRAAFNERNALCHGTQHIAFSINFLILTSSGYDALGKMMIKYRLDLLGQYTLETAYEVSLIYSHSLFSNTYFFIIVVNYTLPQILTILPRTNLAIKIKFFQLKYQNIIKNLKIKVIIKL